MSLSHHQDVLSSMMFALEISRSLFLIVKSQTLRLHVSLVTTETRETCRALDVILVSSMRCWGTSGLAFELSTP